MKRTLSCMLAVSMAAGNVALPAQAAIVSAAEKDQAVNNGIDFIGVKVDKQNAVTGMQLYLNGVYETGIELEPGTHTLQVVNGDSNVGELRTVTLKEKTTVYIRLKDGAVYDSVTNQEEFQYASLVGNFTGLEFLRGEERYDIAAWNPADENARMDYVGGGIYKKTVNFKPLEQELTLADGGYKVAFNGTWDRSIGDGTGNIALTIPAKTSEITFFVDGINDKVYSSIGTGKYHVTQNSGEIEYPAFGMTVSLIGTARENNDTNWAVDAKGYEFTQISDTLFLYQKTFKAGSYEYKVSFNYKDWYEKTDNKRITVTKDDTQVVFLYDASNESLYDSVTDGAVITEKLGMQTAPAESSVTTNANGTTKFVTTVAENETDSVQLVYANRNNPSEFKKIPLQKGIAGNGKFNGTFATSDVFFGDDAVDIIYYYEVNGKKVLDTSIKPITEDGYSRYTRDKFTGRQVYVPGTFTDPAWNPATNPMVYEGNGIYACTFKNVAPANYEFKIAMGSWDENYGQEGKAGGANYQVTVPERQDVTVRYNDISSHFAVTSVDYIIADIGISGRNIEKGTKFTDPGLAGIYTCVIDLPAGTYDDITITYAGKDYKMDSFTVDKDKPVTFYFDPSTDIYYNDSTVTDIDSSKVYFNSKDTSCKSVFGAAEEGQKVTYSIQTGKDATRAQLIVKGPTKHNVELKKTENGDTANWSGDLTIDTYGRYKYFFVVYYGTSVKIYCDDDGNYGSGMLTDISSLRTYDLTVYKKGFKTPDWMKNGVVYQLFPDRFCNGDTNNDDAETSARGAGNFEFITNWSTLPENPEQEQLNPDTYPSNAYKGDGLYSTEIYGGDLKGIINRMDYLKEVGVSIIYLNPVFSSISSHRYDTKDYMNIDPILGTMGDFEQLVKEAKKHNMQIVLDGVFNHVADDSIYFDRYYKYVGKDGKVGAYPYWAYVYDYMDEKNVTKEVAESAAKDYFKGRGVTDFSYIDWFVVTKEQKLKDDTGKEVKDTIGDRKGKPVYGYEGWWGYDSMPVVTSTNGSEFQTGNWGSTVIEGKDSIAQYWLNKGSNGWRLDVANEVSDETWQHLRKSVKSLNEDNVIIGEIWTDATKYLLGDMFDSVMNYVFRDAVLAYAKGGSAKDLNNTLEGLRERYPKEAFYAMMNLVASHDTARVLSSLDGIPDDRGDKTIAGAFPSYENTSAAAKQKQYLVAFLQMTYPGAPMIYYGDEMGMVGADDPDNRRGVTWGEGDKGIVEWYSRLTKMRSEYSALRTGDIKTIDVNDAVLGYVRSDDEDQMIVLMNNSDKEQKVTISANELITLKGNTLYNVAESGEYKVGADGKVEVTIPAYRGVVLTENKKEITINTEALKPAYDKQYKVGSSYRGVSLDKKEQTMKVGDKVTLNATMAPKNTADVKGMTWTSSNEKVATVKDGVVTAKGAGTATITVSLGGKSATCTIKVQGTEKKIGQVQGLRTTKVTDNAISMHWNKVTGATNYEVYRLEGPSWKKVADTNRIDFTDSRLKAETTYKYKVRAYVKENGKAVYGAESSVLTAKTAALPITVGQVQGLKVTKATDNAISIRWNKAAQATNYEVYRLEGASWKKIAETNKTDFTDKKLKASTTYKYKVRAYRKQNGKTTYGKESSVLAAKTAAVVIKVDKASGLKVKAESNKMARLSWKKTKGATGYDIYMKTNKGSFKKIRNIKKGSEVACSIGGLKEGYSYEFKVTAYAKVGNKTVYGKQSDAVKLRMPVSAPKKINASQKGRTNAKVNWTKVTGVSGYEVTMSTNGGKYKKIAVLGKDYKTSLNVTRLKKGTKYRFQVRAYRVVDGKKYYSDARTSNKIKIK